MVDAERNLYLDPTLLPLRTMPPGKGRMTAVSYTHLTLPTIYSV